ncbi:BCD family MFS transporter [Aquabacterium sp.]|uniref:BCD family MFS transporter n=1 Tax=Aquabacterium sp. TaxID=1872578 RepID=UPI003783B19F
MKSQASAVVQGRAGSRVVRAWRLLSPRLLPFADAASTELPLGRLLRLSLFQASVGMAGALMVGTLNRVMILELGVAAWLVSTMVALPLLLAPFRALVGFRSDTHRSVLGWRRVPYLWFGSLLQFGGLAIMPFSLLILSGDTHGPQWVGTVAAALAFLLVGAGMQTTQTAGLALATDLAPEANRPRVVALMYVMLLVGLMLGGLAFGALLRTFSPMRLIQVVQGAAMMTMALNIVALWKQEPRGGIAPAADAALDFRAAWRVFAAQPRTRRFLVAVALGTAAFNMQDIVLEPYGGAVLQLPVAATSLLTAWLAVGALCAFALAARQLQRGADPQRLAAAGALTGVLAFGMVIFSAPLLAPALFCAGVVLIGFGGGLFAVSSLTAAMELADPRGAGNSGLVLGAWGAVQACAAGGAIGLGGALRDGVDALARTGWLGPALGGPTVGYSVVYHLEIALLFATLIAIGPLVRQHSARPPQGPKFGLAEFPG